MKFLGFSTLKDLIKHVIIIILLGLIAVFGFFYLYLPIITNHGETITVPDVVGVHLDDLDDFLERRNLRYDITEDSGFSSTYPPLTVLKQFPKPNAKVKENRKIYLTLNATAPPKVRMPNLVEGSLKNAQLVLKMYDLKLGKTEYIPDLFINTVLEQKIDGQVVEEGEMVPKGSVVDVVLGDGLGQQHLEAPNVIGLDEESAQIAIRGSGLQIGKLTYAKQGYAVIMSEDEEGNETQTKVSVAPGAVFSQHPKPGTTMRLQEIVDIWIYQPDSLNLSPSILDN